MKQDKALQSFRASFEEFEQALNGTSASAMHERRRAAMERLSAQGFPTLRDEEWRYTNLNALFETEYMHPTQKVATDIADIDPTSFLAVDNTVRMVFIDGVFSTELSDLSRLPEGLHMQDLASAISERPERVLSLTGTVDDADVQPFTMLNDAFTQQGALIEADRNAVELPPVHLLFLASGGSQPLLVTPRILIAAESGAELDIIEQYAALGDGTYFTNTVVETHVAENAHLRHYKLQEENRASYHIAASYARVARAASYENHYFGFGGKLLRNNLHTVLDDEASTCTINGLFMPMGSQHMDHHTVIDHAKPHCSSHELYKGLLFDDARGVFSGKIIVRKDAQKTDAKQSNNNLLLSDNALVDTKPQLEIWADDVKCTHGATIGRLDEDAMFYLRSRGLPKEEAHGVLSYAFASELVSHVPLEPLREHLDTVIHKRLERSGTD